MAHGDRARQVRASFKRHGANGAEVTIRQVSDDLDLISDAEKRGIYHTICDFTRNGEIRRVRPGVYVYVGKQKKTDKRRAMWRVMRARKNTTTTVYDLQAMCGVSERYAREYLQMLVKNGLVRRFSGGHRSDGGEVGVRYRLISDPGPAVPEDRKKAARLRAIRAERKKAALAALADAEAAIGQARKILQEES